MVNHLLGIKKKTKLELFILLFLFLVLLIRIGYLQLFKGKELKQMAYEQQSLGRVINPKRGIIYDSNGNILAISSTVESVTVNPTNIKEEDKEKVARKLSEIFELDYEKVLNKVSKNSSIETIVKKIEKEQSNELRKWLIENNITVGVNIDEDTKRYYPYESLASQVIGFCGNDNQGLGGIEAKYENVLKGKAGSIEKQTDAKGGNIDNTNETYNNAIDGNDITLTIDSTIQSIVEKYLEEACIDNVCTDGGNVIVMDPKTGDILAMATYPNYNLNSPFEINSEELKNSWETMSSEDQNNALQAMWRNKAIADTYEPGSTFKLVTASASLEEGITQTDKEGEFCCTGGIEVAGVRIKCWRYYRPHGPESLRTALMNSCNPVFIGLGQRLGVQTYYSYLRKFGFLNKTGIDLPGEASSIFLDENKVGPVELATISFGQRFEVTPIQMITMVSTIANHGEYIYPRLVKEIRNSETGEIEKIEPKKGERVISEETANSVLDMMNSVVSEGTGKNAKVQGYNIGGKTGTSEDGVNTNKYVTSFIGVATIEDPIATILITLYNPTGEGGHQGGGVAAPIAGQIFSEILPYLKANKNEEEKQEVRMPNVTNLTLGEAEKILSEIGVNVKVNSENQEYTKSSTVSRQIPDENITITQDSTIILYVE